MTIEKALDYNWEEHKDISSISFYNVVVKTKAEDEIHSLELLEAKFDFRKPCVQERECRKPCIKHFYKKTIKDSLLGLFSRHIFDKQFRQNMIQSCESQNKKKVKLLLRYDLPPQSYIEYQGNSIEIINIAADTEEMKVSNLPLMPALEMPFEFTLPLHISRIRFAPHPNGVNIQDFCNNAVVWCKCVRGSKMLDTFPKWLDKALQRHKDTILKKKNENQKTIEDRLNKEGGYTMTITMAMNGFLLKYNDSKYLFETVHIDFIERKHKTIMKFEPYKINPDEKAVPCVCYGIAELPNGGKVRMLMPNGMISDKIILDIEGLK